MRNIDNVDIIKPTLWILGDVKVRREKLTQKLGKALPQTTEN